MSLSRLNTVCTAYSVVFAGAIHDCAVLLQPAQYYSSALEIFLTMRYINPHLI